MGVGALLSLRIRCLVGRSDAERHCYDWRVCIYGVLIIILRRHPGLHLPLALMA